MKKDTKIKKGQHLSIETQFKAGQEPWSKGKHLWTNKPHPKGMLGKKMSEETKKKMSIAHKGGNSGSFKKGQPAHNKGKASSSETIQKMVQTRLKNGSYDSMRGKNNWNWKGGVTPLFHQIRMSREYRLWRTAVFERDNYTCIWCGAKNGNGVNVPLNADHIKPFAYFPELRFAIDNGRTLCVPCHKTTESYLKKLKKYE